jgi:hypothetical protein
MSNLLKIGNRLFDGDQIISSLVRYKILETLVGQVILDEAVQNISLSQQELFYALVGPTDAPIPEDFNGFLVQWCQHKNVTAEYFNAVILRELQVEKFKQAYFANQVESEFLRAKSDFDQIEFSLIQITDLSLAQELFFQLRDDGASFSQLAQQYSLGSERQTGGWVGPVSMSTLPVEIAALLSNGQAGNIYGPVPIADRFWIIRLERLLLARLSEATYSNVMNRLYNRWLQAQVRELLSLPGGIAVQADTSSPTTGSLAAGPSAASPSDTDSPATDSSATGSLATGSLATDSSALEAASC